MKSTVSEAEFTRMVLQLAKLRGWRSIHLRPGMNRRGKWQTAMSGDGVGFPDAILIRGNVLLAVELKVGKNTLTAAQEAWLQAFDAVPGCYAYEWRPSDWAAIERVLDVGPGVE